MSVHQAFRRTPVPQQLAETAQTITIPAPTRGIIQNEKRTYAVAAPGDNWWPTLRGGDAARWLRALVRAARDRADHFRL